MRIRKRTPARGASPGPSPALAPAPLALQQPKEIPHEEGDEEEEEKRVILVAGVRDQEDARVAAASKNSSAMDDVPKPEPELGPQDADGGAVRCSRNDGKRWRCKSAVVPGYLFCDRHVAWSTRKRKPRDKKQRNHGSSVLEPTAKELAQEEVAASAEDETGRTPQLGPDSGGDHDDDFYYDGRFRPGCRKRERGGGPEPAA